MRSVLYKRCWFVFVFREELERQQATAHYQKLHAAGKTEEAQADLARLAIIRKQREEQAKKREAEKKGESWSVIYDKSDL